MGTIGHRQALVWRLMVRARRTLPVVDERPRTRGDCEDSARPCPWISCRYHLAILRITPSGFVRLVRRWDDGRATCALDVAEDGTHTLEEIGSYMGMTRERVRQLEERAIERAKLTEICRR